MRRVFVGCAVAVLMAAGLALVVSRQSESAAMPLKGVSDDDPAVSAILSRSCQDCHSRNTRWPWYGHIPPASWLLNSDVQRARSHMNFSRWSQYSGDDKREILTELGAEVRNHEMPPERYLLMHPGARLSAKETEELYAWTKSERRKLREEASKGQP